VRKWGDEHISRVLRQVRPDLWLPGLVFYYADMGPTNVTVENEPKTGALGVIDFEITGHLPRDRVRTKFRVSSGMNLSDSDDPTWLRSEAQKLLGKGGFRDFASEYMS
jgi:hypothetical protein